VTIAVGQKGKMITRKKIEKLYELTKKYYLGGFEDDREKSDFCFTKLIPATDQIDSEYATLISDVFDLAVLKGRSVDDLVAILSLYGFDVEVGEEE